VAGHSFTPIEGTTMTSEMVQVEVWVLVDQDGDYVVGKDNESLAELYDDQVGGDRDTLSLRRVKITLNVPKPKPVELTATVAEEPAAGELQAV